MPPAQERDGVVLLHGIGRSSASMAGMASRLQAAGYHTLNLDYPSRRYALAELADQVRDHADPWRDRVGGDVHFVTHSMGGLLARVLAARGWPRRLRRIVMLAPPNGGSEIADLLAGTAVYRHVYGPAGAQLGTRRDPGTHALLGGPLDCEVGIIAGTRALDPLGWLVLPKPNDGKVALARTRLTGMADHLTLPATHTFIMRHPAVIRATLAFLRDGRFARD